MIQITDDMLTDWYPRTETPARPGLYETRIGSDDPVGVLRKWTGVRWIVPIQNTECAIQRREWRGLTEEAKFYLSWPWNK